MRVKEDFFRRGSFVVGDGTTVRFWEDRWLGNRTLAECYPNLYHIAQRKHVLVADVLSTSPLNIAFRRTLSGSKWNEWIHLCTRLIQVGLSTQSDRFKWDLTDSGVFSVKSMYLDYMNDHTPYLHKFLWKIKIPLKIKFFMWFLSHKVLLTKDNLAKRNWNGCQKCCFCDSMESVEHLFLSCPFAQIIWRMTYFSFNIPPPTNVNNMFGRWLNGVDKTNKNGIRIGVSALCWSIWNCRNNFVFNRTTGTNFLQVIRMMVHWIQLWAHLLPADQREHMVFGSSRLLTVAQDFYRLAGWQRFRRLDA
jgi:hypothetical protein